MWVWMSSGVVVCIYKLKSLAKSFVSKRPLNWEEEPERQHTNTSSDISKRKRNICMCGFILGGCLCMSKLYCQRSLFHLCIVHLFLSHSINSSENFSNNSSTFGIRVKNFISLPRIAYAFTHTLTSSLRFAAAACYCFLPEWMALIQWNDYYLKVEFQFSQL